MGKRGNTDTAAAAASNSAVAVDIVAKAAKVSDSSAASALGSGEDPLKIPAAWLPSQKEKFPKPVLPAPDADHVGRHVMKEVIPWVLQELPTYLQPSGDDL